LREKSSDWRSSTSFAPMPQVLGFLFLAGDCDDIVAQLGEDLDRH